MIYDINVIPLSFITYDNFTKMIRTFRFSYIFLNLYTNHKIQDVF